MVNRLHKVLEDAGVKLATVATDVMGVSGRAMMRALIEGQADPEALAELAKGKLRSKLPALRKALTGRFEEHHAFLLERMLAHIEDLEADIQAITRAHRGGDRPFRASRPATEHDSRSWAASRRGDHRRDRCRHEPLSHSRTSRVLGGDLPRAATSRRASASPARPARDQSGCA